MDSAMTPYTGLRKTAPCGGEGNRGLAAGRSQTHWSKVASDALRQRRIDIENMILRAKDLCDAVFAEQASKYNRDIVFSRAMLPHGAADILYDLFSRRFCHGFLRSHDLSLLEQMRPK